MLLWCESDSDTCFEAGAMLEKKESAARVSKHPRPGRNPVLSGIGKCPYLIEYAALSKASHAWADGLGLFFNSLVERSNRMSAVPSQV
jgi:hypothetical protein